MHSVHAKGVQLRGDDQAGLGKFPGVVRNVERHSYGHRLSGIEGGRVDYSGLGSKDTGPLFVIQFKIIETKKVWRYPSLQTSGSRDVKGGL